ncbi:hypothetical protein JD844_007560 [Phrynosoma platyrhinos]|uniref:EGF-like domain-containing protein n=1 Tax=Phrynosoma platyrhinos TaxID=52577 RepID=A0ABQ7T342_PHRPL|nr:hypothetical protein JD844_007560 [Phrynosoma platyrhinos]
MQLCLDDVDECEEGTSRCIHHCVNTQGSFACTCHPGFELGHDGRQCYLMLLLQKGIVSMTAHDRQWSSSYPCWKVGNRGRTKLISSSKEAVEIREEMIESIVYSYLVCKQEVSSYLLTDNDVILFLKGIEMEIVNSCEDNNGGCSHHCEHSTNGPLCSCNQGYLLDLDGKTCIDVDECLADTDGCDQHCINSLGSYECMCEEGYRLSSINRQSCISLDEDELEEVEEELEVTGTRDLRFKWPPQLLHFSTSLDSFYDEEEDSLHGEFTLVQKVACPMGMYGKDCSSICKCQNGGSCDPVTGQCHCPPGINGKFCENACPKWVYGYGCSEECQCVKENTLNCDPRNGACICKPGYEGTKCQKNCPDGFWGVNCHFACDPCENGGQCNKETGLVPLVTMEKNACCNAAVTAMLCVTPSLVNAHVPRVGLTVTVSNLAILVTGDNSVEAHVTAITVMAVVTLLLEFASVKQGIPGGTLVQMAFLGLTVARYVTARMELPVITLLEHASVFLAGQDPNATNLVRVTVMDKTAVRNATVRMEHTVIMSVGPAYVQQDGGDWSARKFVQLVILGNSVRTNVTVNTATPVITRLGCVTVKRGGEENGVISMKRRSETLKEDVKSSSLPCDVKMEEREIPACLPGTYGENCNQLCQCSGKNEECHHVTGKCGCLPGYYGIHCDLRK